MIYKHGVRSMGQINEGEYSLQDYPAPSFKQAVIENCNRLDVRELLELADELHELIRKRRSEARRASGEGLDPTMADYVFVD